jgi:hypothetical protein
VGVETVLVAFRTGLATLDVARRLENDDGGASWSIIVQGVSAEQASEGLISFTEINVGYLLMTLLQDR